MHKIIRLSLLFIFLNGASVMPTTLQAGPRVGCRFEVSDRYCAIPCESLRDRRGRYHYYAPETVFSGVVPLVNKNNQREIVYVVNDTVQCIVHGTIDMNTPFSSDTIMSLLRRYTTATDWRRIPEAGFFERVENEFLPVDTSYRKFTNTAGTLVAWCGKPFYARYRFHLIIMNNTFPLLCARVRRTGGAPATLLDSYRLGDTIGLREWAARWHDESRKRCVDKAVSDRTIGSARSIMKDFMMRITRPGGDSTLGSAPRQPYYVMGTTLNIRVAEDTAIGDIHEDRTFSLDITVNNFYPVSDVTSKKIVYLDDTRQIELLDFLGRSDLCNAFNNVMFIPSDETEAEKRRQFLSQVIDIQYTGQIQWCALRSWQCTTGPAVSAITFDPAGTRAVLTCSVGPYSGCSVEYRKDATGWRLTRKLGEWVN
jgi:hypothetical protein